MHVIPAACPRGCCECRRDAWTPASYVDSDGCSQVRQSPRPPWYSCEDFLPTNRSSTLHLKWKLNEINYISVPKFVASKNFRGIKTRLRMNDLRSRYGSEIITGHVAECIYLTMGCYWWKPGDLSLIFDNLINSSLVYSLTICQISQKLYWLVSVFTERQI